MGWQRGLSSVVPSSTSAGQFNSYIATSSAI